MALEQDDPRCPECDGPVSATAPYCMHCGADLDPGETEVPSTTTDESGESTLGTVRSWLGSKSSVEADTAGSHLLHPDSIADNTLTVLVGIVGGAVIGVLTLGLFLFTTQSLWSFLPALLVWLGGTGYLVTRRTVGVAFQYCCYGVAFLLVAVPVIAFSGATKGGTFAGRVILFVVGELFFGLLALVVAALGYTIGS